MTPKIEDRIRAALSASSMSRNQLAKAIDASPAELQAEFRRLATSGRIYNVSSAEYPMWTWRIGDQTSSEELLETVIRLLGERPMTMHELANATGATLRRVALAVRAIQRGPHKEDLMHVVRVDSDEVKWCMLPGGYAQRPGPQRQPLRPEAPALGCPPCRRIPG